MPLRRRILALVAFPIFALAGAACAPGTLEKLFGAVNAGAPAVASLADAYTATAKAFASPSAAPVDVDKLAAALAARDTCTVNASVALDPAGTPDGAKALAKMQEQLDADTRLIAALVAVHADPIDGGAK